jgi:hypothetical protein
MTKKHKNLVLIHLKVDSVNCFEAIFVNLEKISNLKDLVFSFFLCYLLGYLLKAIFTQIFGIKITLVVLVNFIILDFFLFADLFFRTISLW